VRPATSGWCGSSWPEAKGTKHQFYFKTEKRFCVEKILNVMYKNTNLQKYERKVTGAERFFSHAPFSTVTMIARMTL
jgi:hypothetical protein